MDLPAAATIRAYPDSLPAFPQELAGQIRITVDGADLSDRAYAYDTVEGYVLVDKRKDDGTLLIQGDELVAERICGIVEICKLAP